MNIQRLSLVFAGLGAFSSRMASINRGFKVVNIKPSGTALDLTLFDEFQGEIGAEFDPNYVAFLQTHNGGNPEINVIHLDGWEIQSESVQNILVSVWKQLMIYGMFIALYKVEFPQAFFQPRSRTAVTYFV